MVHFIDENNDVAKGFIGCHVISIMILPVQYAFSV